MHLPILPAAKRALLRACALVVLISFVTGIDAVAEQGPPLQISISAPGISNEFSATPALSWTADAGVSYLIQVSTNIADPSAWQDADMTAASAAGPVKWMAPESLRDTKFYRLVTSPAVFDVQPAFISLDDTNAWLYLVGQMLPSDGFVSINGHNFGMQHDSTGNSGDVWRISLNGLPLGEPISGAIIVLDAASNVVATLPLQSSIVYGTEMPAEQLQGPPDAPPACPARKEFKGHVTLMKAFDDDAGDEMMSARGHTKSGHVTLMKAFDDGSEDEAAERGLPVIVKPPPHCPAAFFGGGGGGSFDESGASIERRLPITNLGSSGQDGVDIQLRRLPGGNLGSSGQDGVVDFSGESRLQVTDLAIPGAAMDFEWTRSYRSRTGPTTSQGSGWDFSYNVSLSENSDGTVTLHPGNGRADTFYPAGTNGWFRDEYFCQIIDLNGDGYPDVLFADSSRWLFNPLATGGTAGKLAQIIDRNGNTMSLNYDAKGRLIEIVDDLGRTNTVSYNISGQISGVTDFSGRTVSYEYDANGDLVSVISPPVASTPTGDDFPNGITNRYTYTSGNTDERLNHNLATCVDGKGQSWLQITYQATTDSSSVDFDRVDSVRTYKSGGVVCACSHLRCYPQTPSPANNFAVIKAITHDGVGNVAECFYDSRGRCVRELDYTGRCDPSLPVTENDNRPTGKLRSDDPDFFETLWTWNADSLCISETMPDGEVVQTMYQRAFNQNASRSNHTRYFAGLVDPTLHNGDARVVRLEAAPGGGGDLDGDGVPDITELTWHFEYDPRFGTPSPTDGARSRPRGWDGLIYKRGGGSSEALCSLGFVPDANGVAINTKGTGADKGRVAGGLPNGSVVPTRSSYAINTKGAGTNGRMAINTKGTGAGKDRVADGLPDGSVVPIRSSYAINTKGAGTNGRMALTSGQPEIVNNEFCISLTDPRGIVTTATYDSKGNLQSCQRKGGSVIAADYNYRCNARGQLITITNAPDPNGYRRVDTITYYSSGPQNGWPQSIAIDEPGTHLTSSFEYDAVGNLTRCVDPRGNDWLYSYDALDQCVSLQTPTNINSRCTSIFGYDANGNCYIEVVEYKDGEDSTTHTRPGRRYFDALDRCVSSVSQVFPGTLITNQFDYDADGGLVAAYSPMAVSGADPNAVTQFEYDERGLLFRVITPPSSMGLETNQYDYDSNGACKRVSSIDSFTWKQCTVSYDGFHRPVSATDPMGNVGTRTYDRNGNCTMVRCYGETNDAPGGAGNILLAQTQYTYDALDRCIQTRDVYNNPVSQSKIGKGVAVTTRAYAPNGACSSVTDDNGHTTTYLYDTAMRLEGFVTPSRKALTQWVYDPAGNVISETISNQPDGASAQVFTRSFSYDSRNRCVAASDNVGNTNRYVYDSFSRCVQATSPNGVQSWSSYDDLGRCVLSAADLDRDGLLDLAVDSWTSCAYDDNSRCVASTDGNTNTTYYAYDSLGDCIHVMNGDGSILSLVWSPRSNLIASEDANGTTVTNTYDLRDRIVHRDIAARNVLATTTFENFAYDGLDRCVSAANDSSTSTFAYDSLGDCLSSTQDGFTTTYSYDGVGNNLSITYPGGRVASYTYNEENDVSTMSSTAPGSVQAVLLASYTYAGPGRLSGITRANGVTTTVQWDGLSNPGNAQGDYGWMQVRGISHASGGVAIDQRRNSFDRDQNLVFRAMAAPALASGLETNILAYDACDRLVDFASADASATHQIDWSLDKLGNRIAETNDSAVGLYTSVSTLPPGDFQMNRYTTTPFATENYDADGNLVASSTSAGPVLYAYDYANRLVQVSTMSGGSLSVVETCAYDALGRRISRAVTSSGVQQTTTFIYGNDDCDDSNGNGDESRVIEEHSNGAVKKTFVMPHVLEKSGIQAKQGWPCRWEMAMQDDPGDTRTSFVVPHLLETSGSTRRSFAQPHVFETSGRVAFDADTTPLFEHHDNLGNLLAITDASGIVLERYHYDAFGSPTFLTPDGVVKTDSTGATAKVSDFGMSRLFRAMFWEDSLGLYYASGDDEMPKECIDFYYAPSTGRSLGRVCTCPPGIYSAYDPFAGNPWSQPSTYKTKPPKSTGSIKKDMTGHVTLIK